ncbi:hypothetical protein [Clostridium sp.]|uniref:hypothetical protein n=1 Tax=Clostridium sp. TaxID=1506 RepID=UPI0039922E2F
MNFFISLVGFIVLPHIFARLTVKFLVENNVKRSNLILLLIPGFISSMAVIAMRERFNNNGEYGIKIQLFFIILYLFLISSTFIDFFKSKIKKKYL